MTGNESESASGLLGKVAGKSKEIAGSVLGNDDLKDEGRIQQRKVQADADAANAEAKAQQREAEAELAIKKDDLEIERQRMDLEDANKHAEDHIERDRQRELISVEGEIRQKKAASQRQKAVQESAIDQAEAAGLRQHQIEVVEAAQTEHEANEARRAGEILDAAVKRSTN